MAAAIPPPLEVTELTTQILKKQRFTYRFWQRGDTTFLELEFPVRIGEASVHSTDVKSKTKSGAVLAQFTNWVAGNKFHLLETKFNHVGSDAEVSVSYVCAQSDNRCGDAMTFQISSVSRFIANSKNAESSATQGASPPNTSLERTRER